MTDYIGTAKPVLTDRQVLMLGLVAEGLTTDEIAARLWVTDNTVKSTLSNARRRLKAKNTPHAVALAFRAGALS